MMRLFTLPALRCFLLISLFFLFGIHSAAAVSTDQWTRSNLGGGGWFERMGVGADGLVLAASDLAGAYRSFDYGVTWDIIGAKQGLTTTHVASFGFYPADSGVFFLGTDNGIYRASQRGDVVEQVLSNGYIESIVFAPNQENTGYAGWHSQWNQSDGQVYKTTDGGQTWQITTGKLPKGLRILKMLVSANNANEVYVLTGAGRFAKSPAKVFRSADGGVSWQAIDNSLTGRVVDIALDKFDLKKIWLTTDDAKAKGHLYVSTHRGDSWRHVVVHGGAIWLDDKQPQTIRLFDPRYQFAWDLRQGFWETTDDGKNWARIGSVENWQKGWSKAFWSFTAPVHGVAVDPNHSEHLYWSNNQFVFASHDKGRTVTQLYANSEGNTWRSSGLDNVVINTIATSVNGDVWAGFYDLGLWRSQDGGKTWMNCNRPLFTGSWQGFGGDTLTLLTDPVRAGVVWATQAESPTKPARLLKSLDPGANCDKWTVVGKGLPKAPLYGLSLAPDSSGQKRILYITGRGMIYNSQDDGLTWRRVMKKRGFYSTAVATDGTVYAGGEAGLWRSPVGGVRGKWREIGLPDMRGAIKGPPARGWEGVYSIAVDAAHPEWIYAVVSGKNKGLYLSKNRGETWVLLLQDHFLRSITIDPNNSNLLYATSSSALSDGGYDPGSHGVWRSTDGGISWAQVNEGLVWNFALTLALDPKNTKRAYIGSPGAGIYQRQFAP